MLRRAQASKGIFSINALFKDFVLTEPLALTRWDVALEAYREASRLYEEFETARRRTQTLEPLPVLAEKYRAAALSLAWLGPHRLLQELGEELESLQRELKVADVSAGEATQRRDLARRRLEEMRAIHAELTWDRIDTSVAHLRIEELETQLAQANSPEVADLTKRLAQQREAAVAARSEVTRLEADQERLDNELGELDTAAEEARDQIEAAPPLTNDERATLAATPFATPLGANGVTTSLRAAATHLRDQIDRHQADRRTLEDAVVSRIDTYRNLDERTARETDGTIDSLPAVLKHSPFEDQPRRTLVGAACVEGVTLPGRWPTTGPTAFPNHMWETIVRHTLRADGSGGILLPVQHLATLASNGTDVASTLGQAPETRREFSYATEHVPADTAVAALLELERAARAAIALGCSIPEQSFDWLDDQLRLAWLRRGPAPGLPAVLVRLGFEHPTFSARMIMSAVDDGNDPWPVLVDALEGRGGPPQVRRLATDPRRRIWSKQDEETKSALQLLARFDLTADEVDRVLDGRTTMPFTVSELRENPYHLVTCSIDDGDPIPFETVDRGCFPDLQVTQHHPLPVTRPLIDPIDERRVEAAIATILLRAQAEGHTLLPTSEMIQRLDRLSAARPIAVTLTVLQGLGLEPADLDADEEATWPQLTRTELYDGTPAYKLRSAARRRRWILDVMERLHAADRHPVPSDLTTTLTAALDPLTSDESDPSEVRARAEKLAALRELYQARLTILNGPAGTGKTTSPMPGRP